MATLIANQALNMDQIPSDLDNLTDVMTQWTDTPVQFFATDGSVTIHGTGTSFSPFPGHPTSGNLDGLSVDYGSSHAYSFSGLGTTLDDLVNDLHVDGSQITLEIMLGGNDAITGSTGADVLKGFGGDDVMRGGKGNDVLDGGVGNDRLIGGAGADRLIGGDGKDTLTGGPGHDHFVFSAALNAATNVDRITDFSVADRIELDHNVFAGIGAPGSVLSGAAFHQGHHAHDASDHIIYNKATGALYYDANGNAPGGEVKFAVVADHATLTHADFLIV
jgi:Ca2+-binding RTX toxin-like protein